MVAQDGAATIDIANSFGRLNPVLSTAIGELTINNAVFNKVPDLLAAPPSQVDDLTWNLEFRQGVMFHDGTEMKASDFVFTLDLIQNPETASLFANFLTLIDGRKRPATTAPPSTSTRPLACCQSASLSCRCCPKPHSTKKAWIASIWNRSARVHSPSKA